MEVTTVCGVVVEFASGRDAAVSGIFALLEELGTTDDIDPP